MSKLHQHFLLLILQLSLIKSSKISSCIPNTPCQCYLTQYSLTLYNCSHKLSDLPIFNSKNTANITKIIARNAFNQWPIQLCKYVNLQILDLSGSYFNSEFVDLSCLNHLIHLNLSNSQLNQIPYFKENFSNHLQILDLSKILDGIRFQSLKHLISLFLQNNPMEYIQNLEFFFNLTNLETINFISSNSGVRLKHSLTNNQWIKIAHQWNNSKKSLMIRTNNIPFQFIIPHPDQFEIVSTNAMKIIFKMFMNSTFLTRFNTPICNCMDLRNYQRMFSFVDYRKKYSSPLFESVQCLMSDGITHARLFDRRTTIDLRCSMLGKISLFPLLSSSASTLNCTIVAFFLVYLFAMC